MLSDVSTVQVLSFKILLASYLQYRGIAHKFFNFYETACSTRLSCNKVNVSFCSGQLAESILLAALIDIIISVIFSITVTTEGTAITIKLVVMVPF
jgi:hypothetical protein